MSQSVTTLRGAVPTSSQNAARRIAFDNETLASSAALGERPPRPGAGTGAGAGQPQSSPTTNSKKASAAVGGGGVSAVRVGDAPGDRSGGRQLLGMSSALQSSIDALAASAKMTHFNKHAAAGKAAMNASMLSAESSGSQDDDEEGTGEGFSLPQTGRPPPPQAAGATAAQLPAESDYASIGHRFLERLKAEEQAKRQEAASRLKVQEQQQQQRAPIPYESFLIQHQQQRQLQQQQQQNDADSRLKPLRTDEAVVTSPEDSDSDAQTLRGSSSAGGGVAELGGSIGGLRMRGTNGVAMALDALGGDGGVGSDLTRRLQLQARQQEKQIARLQEERQRTKKQMQEEYDALYKQVWIV